MTGDTELKKKKVIIKKGATKLSGRKRQKRKEEGLGMKYLCTFGDRGKGGKVTHPPVYPCFVYE